MTAVMAVHLKQGLSIAYYSGVDNALLGGADFPFPASGGIVRICMSGKAGDGSFQTFCENIHQDNDIYGVTGDPFCIIAVGQDFVTDGCYVPESKVVSANSPSSGSSQTIPPIASTLTFGATMTTTTIAVNGTIQTVVVVSSNSDRSGSNYGENVVLPIVLTVLGIILIAICLGAWLWRKHLRLQRQLLLNPPVGRLPVGVSEYTFRHGLLRVHFSLFRRAHLRQLDLEKTPKGRSIAYIWVFFRVRFGSFTTKPSVPRLEQGLAPNLPISNVW